MAAASLESQPGLIDQAGLDAALAWGRSACPYSMVGGEVACQGNRQMPILRRAISLAKGKTTKLDTCSALRITTTAVKVSFMIAARPGSITEIEWFSFGRSGIGA
jgi:hypothetical protein